MKIFPKSLKKGDKIAIISPAGSVEPAQLEKGLEMIKSKGYEPVLGENLYTKFSKGYNYAGTESERLKDINWALNDSEISAIWTSRGGYGCQHLLEGLNLKEFAKNPKWYIGYSDNTVIQSYLLKKGFVSIHGQTIKTSSFGVTTESYDLPLDGFLRVGESGYLIVFNLKLNLYFIINHHFNLTSDNQRTIVFNMTIWKTKNYREIILGNSV